MTQRELTIGFLSANPPTDRKASSGTAFSVYRQITKIGGVKWIPLTTPPFYQVVSLFMKILGKIFKKTVNPSYVNIMAKWFAHSFDYKAVANCDILFFYFCGSRVAYLKPTRQPSLIMSDATFPAMVDYYSSFSNMPKWNVRQGTNIEKLSLDYCDRLIFCSDWAAKSAINDLKQNSNKVKVVEIGANIDDKDIIPKTFSYNRYLDILFLGVDWERKGGQLAVEAVKWLNENDISTTLHIIGIRKLDADIVSLPFVENIGFLNKNNKGDYDKLVRTIKTSHLLLLPTQAECAGIAFVEASAYGLPSFTHDTGGISNYITNGENGYMLPLGSTGEDFGRKIKNCLENGELEKMTSRAPQVYKKLLNWDVWGVRVGEIINELVN